MTVPHNTNNIEAEKINELSQNLTTGKANDQEDFKALFIAGEERKREHKQYQSLKNSIKKIAEELGFKTIKEVSIKDDGLIDLLLNYESLKIAIKLLTTSDNDEIQNIQKYIPNVSHAVYLISDDTKYLRSIREQVISTISSNYHSQLHFLTKQQCIEQLDILIRSQRQPTTTIICGYKVTVKWSNALSSKDYNTLLSDVARAINNSLQ